MFDKKIIKFIGRHHVMTLSTISEDGAPYCSNAFYAFDEGRGALIFSANSETLHGEHMARDPRVAASIVLETKVVGKLQGLQILGEVSRGDEKDKRSYIQAYPFAAAIPLSLWRMDMNFIKLTDNTLGFGKKLIWQRD